MQIRHQPNTIPLIPTILEGEEVLNSDSGLQKDLIMRIVILIKFSNDKQNDRPWQLCRVSKKLIKIRNNWARK